MFEFPSYTLLVLKCKAKRDYQSDGNDTWSYAFLVPNIGHHSSVAFFKAPSFYFASWKKWGPGLELHSITLFSISLLHTIGF